MIYIFKGEKEAKMVCKEFAKGTCKSYPNCRGCGANATEKNGTGKNLIVKHRFAAKTYKDGEYDNAVDLTDHDMVWEQEDNHIWASGEVTDRLHEFEKLGYDPEQLERIIKLWRVYRQAAHSQYGMTQRNYAAEALYHLYKAAGNVELSYCNDIRDMYPTTLFTKEGFAMRYAADEEFRKHVFKTIEGALEKAENPRLKNIVRDLVNERIVKEITKPFDINRPVDYQKVWVTTSSSIKDDEFTKKVKEAMKSFNLDDGPKLYVPENWKPVEIKWPKFNYTDTDSIRGGFHHSLTDKVCFVNTYDATKVSPVETSPSKIGAQVGEEIREVFDEAMRNYIYHDIEMTRKFVDSITVNKEKTPMTVTKKPEYQFKIKRVLFNNPATIVFWADGDKTVVKCQNGEPYDPEKGLSMAIAKKALGNDRAYYNVFARFCKNRPSEVAHREFLEQVQEDLDDARYASRWAYELLEKVYTNPKSTKAELLEAINLALGGLHRHGKQETV